MSKRKEQNEGRRSERTIETDSASAVQYLIYNAPETVKMIFTGGASSPRVQDLVHTAKNLNLLVDTSPQREKKLRARITAPAFIPLEDAIEANEAHDSQVYIALDHIQDPQNFGALCRSIEGLGGSGIIFPKDRGVTIGEGVVNASVGAVAGVPLILVSNLTDAILKLKKQGFWIYGTSLAANSVDLPLVTPSKKSVIVLGTEWEGLSPSIEKHCDFLVKIPLRGKVDSLNVSVAGAILLYNFLHSPKS